MKAEGAGKTGARLCVSAPRRGKAAVNTPALQTLPNGAPVELLTGDPFQFVIWQELHGSSWA